MTENDFIKELKNLNVYYTEEMLDKLDVYFRKLVEYNEHTNLTNITKKEDVYLKHFLDSLTIIKAYSFNENISLLDIGTGAGFPGLVLKIFFPGIKLVLLDSNNKKTLFLKQVCQLLDLEDVLIVNKRAEEYVREARESFDVVTSRAVAKTRILCELSLPFLKNNGYLLLMKASDDVTNSELEESKATINLLNSEIVDKIRFSLPIENSQRNLIVIKKLNNIDNKYPRDYDKILKKPLK